MTKKKPTTKACPFPSALTLGDCAKLPPDAVLIPIDSPEPRRNPELLLRLIVSERRILMSAMNQALNAATPERQQRIAAMFDAAEALVGGKPPRIVVVDPGCRTSVTILPDGQEVLHIRHLNMLISDVKIRD